MHVPKVTEYDKVQIAFGNSPLAVPEPSTYIAGLLLGLPILVNGIRVLRKNRRV